MNLIPDYLARRGVDFEASIQPYSLLSPNRLLALLHALERSKSVEGDTAEIGCAAGGTSIAIASLNYGRKHWAVDTFKGLLDCGPVDTDLRNNDFGSRRCTLEIVEPRFSGLPNAKVIKGFFPDCAPPEMDAARFAFVHIDVDTYASMTNCLKYFRPRMSIGGHIAMDDVIGRGTVGAKQAWKEFDQRGLSVVSSANPQLIVRVERG